MYFALFLQNDLPINYLDRFLLKYHSDWDGINTNRYHKENHRFTNLNIFIILKSLGAFFGQIK